MNRFQLIGVAAFCMGLAWSMHQATFNNFVGETLELSAPQLGLLHSLREIPGLLALTLSLLLVYVSESKMAALSLLIFGVGLGSIALTNNFSQLVVPTLVMSTGFHFFYPLRSSMTIDISQPGSQAENLGKIGSVMALAALCAFGVVLVLVDTLKFRGIFLLAGVIGAAGAFVLFPLKVADSPAKRPHIILRRKYLTYYFLEFFSGCRRHIFSTFAVFSLVVIHGLTVKQVTILLAVSNITNLYTRTKIGRLIDHFGEKSVLTIAYTILIFVFLGYAYLETIYFLAVLYCVDNVLFGVNIAFPSYLSKIGDKSDLAPSLAFGSTINHVASIIIPVVGGLVWNLYGYGTTFILGAALLLFSLFLAQRIKA